jgi:capsular polysaccharide biosynthesis protein
MSLGRIHYGHTIINALPLLLLISLFFSASVFSWMHYHKPSSEVHFSYLISLSERDLKTSYSYDGYYALQASESFAETLAFWIQTPEMVVSAYRAANIPLPTTDARVLVKSIRAKKSAPQLVQVTIYSKDEGQAKRLAEGLRQAVEENMNIYHDEGIPDLKFKAVPTGPWLGKQRVSVFVIVFTVFIATLLLGINVVLLKESLNDSK